MVHRQIMIEQVAPWVVTGASNLYILVRARRLSMARACRVPLSSFLLQQSDMILALFGAPAIWYFARLRRNRWGGEIGAGHPHEKMTLSRTHQLRQVFTALLIGTGLLVHKASQSKNADLVALAERLHKIVHDGIDTLDHEDDPRRGHPARDGHAA